MSNTADITKYNEEQLKACIEATEKNIADLQRGIEGLKEELISRKNNPSPLGKEKLSI